MQGRFAVGLVVVPLLAASADAGQAQTVPPVHEWLPLRQPPVPPNGVNLAPLPPGVDPTLAVQIADVVAAARRTLDGMGLVRLPLVGARGEAARLAPMEIELVLAQGRPYHGNVATDRDHTIYVRVEPQGIGDEMRGDAGPVAVLCEAVAELHNAWRLPGLNRYLSHSRLVPAVVGELGGEVPSARHPTPLAPDGPEMLAAMTRDEYTCVHPDLAAVAAIQAVEGKLGLEGLLNLLKSLPLDAEDPFAAFRAAATKADPGLAGAFGAWDQANSLEPDEDGSYLVTSFEPGENVQRIASLHPLRSIAEIWFDATPETRCSFSEDWSSDGEQSLKLEADETAGWVAFYIRDPDWQFRDLSRFGSLELDLVLDAVGLQPISIRLNDHVSDGHGELHILDDVLAPGEERRVVYELTEENLQGQQDVDASYFSGRFRADSAARLCIGLGKPKQRVTLYLDHIRFTPRAQLTEGPVAPALATRAEPVRVETPPAARASYEEGGRLKQAGRYPEAAEALRAALQTAPDDADAHWALAWVLIELNDREGAKQEFRRVIGLAPGSAKARDAQAALERLGNQ